MTLVRDIAAPHKPLLLNDKVCMVYEDNSTHSVFETEEGGFVLHKEQDKLYKMKPEAFIKLIVFMSSSK